MKTQIQYINKKEKGGWIGMNELASQAHFLKWKHKKHPEHTIEIYKGSPHSVRVVTIKHEKIELYVMRKIVKKGYSLEEAYQIAHYKFALYYEELKKPMSQIIKLVNLRLKKLGYT
jgi:hypothetical protein